MKINISGHHLSVKDSIKEHVEEKLAKISEHFPELISTNVILTIDNKKNAIAEFETVYHGHKVAVKDSKDNISVAINRATDKLHRVLVDRKGIEQAARTDKIEQVEQDHTHEHLQNLQLN